MKLDKLSKKVRENKGFTGTDVAAAVAIVVVTMAVVAGIYINLVNKSKDNLRYSAATRIATQIMENVQRYCYDEVVYRGEVGPEILRKNFSYTNGSIFDVKVPKGYSAEVKLSDAKEIDIIRDVTVIVKYTVGKTEKNITLYTVKEKELLEQTNKPNINLISGYRENSNSYYPLRKLENGNYIITTTGDKDWYNYDSGKAALVLKTDTGHKIGEELGVATLLAGSNKVFAWIPRYGKLSSENLSIDNLCYAYGTTNYAIQFALSSDNKLMGYFISGVGSGETFKMNLLRRWVRRWNI